jgi:isopenicillin N synthase-like dioxygenase
MIPVLDASALLHDREAAAQALAKASSASGTAIIINHQVPLDVAARVADGFARFYALPDADKRAFHVPGIRGQRGYTPFGIETAPGATAQDRKEFWHWGRHLPDGHPQRGAILDNVADPPIAGLGDDSRALFAAMEQVALRILSLMAVYFKLPADHFEHIAGAGNNILRVTHYPPVDAGTGFRAHAMEDVNLLSLHLHAEHLGLEVLGSDDRWHKVTPPPGALVVTSGDMLQRVTNDLAMATTHRTRAPATSSGHIDLAFYAHLNPDYPMTVLPGCAHDRRPNRYPEPISAQAFVEAKLAAIKLV